MDRAARRRYFDDIQCRTWDRKLHWVNMRRQCSTDLRHHIVADLYVFICLLCRICRSRTLQIACLLQEMMACRQSAFIYQGLSLEVILTSVVALTVYWWALPVPYRYVCSFCIPGYPPNGPPPPPAYAQPAPGYGQPGKSSPILNQGQVKHRPKLTTPHVVSGLLTYSQFCCVHS